MVQLQGGRAQHVGYVRNKHPFLCPVRAMGVFMFYKYTVGSQRFPMPSNKKQWWVPIVSRAF